LAGLSSIEPSGAQAILSLVDEDFARACLMQYGMKRLEELREEEAK
jgi:hypothetical protein